MKVLHADLVPENFVAAPGTVEALYCQASGLLASDECTKTEIGVYKTGHLPPPCDQHGPYATTTAPSTTTSETTSATTEAAA